MINSRSTKQLLTTPTETLPELKKTSSSSQFDKNILNPSSISLTSLKFEPEGEIGAQSPESSSWEAFLSEIAAADGGDFMVLSPPVRNIPSPKYNYSYNYTLSPTRPLGCSPPRSASDQLVAYSSIAIAQKGKRLKSPLHNVFNSPDNFNSMPALESFLGGDDNFMKYSGGESNYLCDERFDRILTSTVPELLDCLTMPNNCSRFCGGSQESHVYQMVGGSVNVTPPVPPPLSQQLQQERYQEKQQKDNFNHSSMELEQEQDSGLELVHILLACAEAVSKEDYMLARRYLHHLNQVVTPLGDSMQRVASCFTEALGARLAATLSPKPITSTPKPFTPFPPNSLEILKIYQILYQACPYIKFAHFTANQAIFEAFEAEERVHVIDLDILQGYQWPAFMQALAARPGGAPFLRITGFGPFPDLRETGRCLTELAHSLRIPFEFHPVGEELENIKPHMFNRRVGEALAVNSVNRLHRVPPNCLGNLLAMIRDQAPKIVTIVEQEASHNGPYFLGRFLEALHYYSAIFDSLDATFPPDSAQRAKVEQYIFAPEIRNIVACEGQERVMRHERLEKWRKVMEGKGFEGVPLSENAVTQSKILLGLYSCDGYRVTEDKDCLLLGWQDRAILAASAWQC